MGNLMALPAKVSWKDVCYPKRQGGLGLKSLEVWNQTSMLRHVWSLFARSGSIWVAWVSHNLAFGVGEKSRS
jgi:hypothetical protein